MAIVKCNSNKKKKKPQNKTNADTCDNKEGSQNIIQMKEARHNIDGVYSYLNVDYKTA